MSHAARSILGNLALLAGLLAYGPVGAQTAPAEAPAVSDGAAAVSDGAPAVSDGAPAKAAATEAAAGEAPLVRLKVKRGAPRPIGADRLVTPSPTQSEQMLEGTNAYRAKDFRAAIEAYARVLSEGPINIAFLNKGRSHQRLGECAAAAEAFGEVVDAPAVRNPSPDTVRGALNRYTEQLAQECPGTLLVQCSPGDARLTLTDPNAGMGDAAEPPAAMPAIGCGRPVELPAGRYRVTMAAYERTRSYQATVVGVQMSALMAEIPPPPELVVKEVEAPMHPLRVAAWGSFTLAGAGLLAGSLGTYLVLDNNDRIALVANEPAVGRRELESLRADGATYESVQLWSYGTMVVAAVAGAVLYQMSEDADDDGRDGPELLPIATPGGAGATLHIRF